MLSQGQVSNPNFFIFDQLKSQLFKMNKDLNITQLAALSSEARLPIVKVAASSGLTVEVLSDSELFRRQIQGKMLNRKAAHWLN